MGPTFREADRGSTVQVVVGVTFCVELSENPTTGYRWSQPDLDGTRLAALSDAFAPTAGSGAGGGGTRRFFFIVKSAGKTTMHFAYRRPWQAGAEPAERFDVTVIGSH